MDLYDDIWVAWYIIHIYTFSSWYLIVLTFHLPHVLWNLYMFTCTTQNGILSFVAFWPCLGIVNVLQFRWIISVIFQNLLVLPIWSIQDLFIWQVLRDYTYHFILLRLNPFDLSLKLIGRDGGLSTLCHSCGFACQQRVLKTFPGPGYLHSKDGVVWLCHSLAIFYFADFWYG